MRYLRIIAYFLAVSAATAQTPHWTAAFANDWYAKQPWMVGSNYVPSNAVNQIEMWQADKFDPVRIDMELAWAESLGMNVMRVFLHDVLWQQDAAGFEHRIDRFLRIADHHKIRVIFVLFDSCWNPFPEPFSQPPARPGVHNSGWVQGPGARVLMDPKLQDRVLEYAKDIIANFREDKRVLAWDLWNEPDNRNSSLANNAEPKNKSELVQSLLTRVFEYARAGLPQQPLTTGLWNGDWSSPDKLTPMEKLQLDQSDIITFHNYDKPEEFEKRVKWLQAFNRPILCTEYMARPRGSTFQGILPIAKKYKVAAINWGFVAGKTQTWLPWDSWQHPYVDSEPDVWFHDVLHPDGKPYSQDEVNFIKEIIGPRVKTKK